MDIIVPDIWLREYLKTKASVKEISEKLSLCGPNVERITKSNIGPVYSIEVTGNRVDLAGIFQLAKEASAILKRFGISASLIKPNLKKVRLTKQVSYLSAKVDYDLCSRFSAVLISNVKVMPSPSWMANRLKAIGLRPINNVVDISNYLMHELGQPVHTFDYDLIAGHQMTLRKSKPGEEVITLDNQKVRLLGNDIVIEDGRGRIIDLAGIMGGANSAVSEKTQNVLLFVQTYNPQNIRRTTMTTGKRSEASILFEKDLDWHLVPDALFRGIYLFETITRGKASMSALDLYNNADSTKAVDIPYDFIDSRLGVKINKNQIKKYLDWLDFKVKVKAKGLSVTPPSYRNKDITIKEDVLEEIARMYGYFNLPSELMSGRIPADNDAKIFDFESRIKNELVKMGFIEIYTSPLVNKISAGVKAVRIKNPLGRDCEYLRTSLLPSLVSAASQNHNWDRPFCFFEMANVYWDQADNLPSHNMTLAGIFANTDYRHAKGFVEFFLSKQFDNYQFVSADIKGFTPSAALEILSRGKKLGIFGEIEDHRFYYFEFYVNTLYECGRLYPQYRGSPSYPPQIEDLTVTLPEKTAVGNVIESIKSVSNISRVELKDIYNNSYTFTVYFQDPQKTLTNSEVEKIRNEVYLLLKSKYSVF